MPRHGSCQSCDTCWPMEWLDRWSREEKWILSDRLKICCSHVPWKSSFWEPSFPCFPPCLKKVTFNKENFLLFSFFFVPLSFFICFLFFNNLLDIRRQLNILGNCFFKKLYFLPQQSSPWLQLTEWEEWLWNYDLEKSQNWGLLSHQEAPLSKHYFVSCKKIKC